MIPFIASPNFSRGRRGLKPVYVVIHAMSGSYKGSIQWFLNPKSKVSAHYCVSQSGQITQMVHEEDRAWHVGNANAYAIGIEMEDLGRCLKDKQWITPAMYKAVLQLTVDICERNNIPAAGVLGHNDPIMRNYGNNHADPGLFDMVAFRADVQKALAAEVVSNCPCVPVST